ncbi:MAG: hypothetical protein ACREFO_11595, partial [Acetobacteraceae bacterium]
LWHSDRWGKHSRRRSLRIERKWTARSHAVVPPLPTEAPGSYRAVSPGLSRSITARPNFEEIRHRVTGALTLHVEGMCEAGSTLLVRRSLGTRYSAGSAKG